MIKTKTLIQQLLIFLLIVWNILPTFADLAPRKTAYTINHEPIKSEETYITTILPKLYLQSNNKQIKTQKYLILSYCNAVLNTPIPLLVGKDQLQFMYDPKQSLFVLSLCMTVAPSYDRYFPYLQNEDGKYYKKYHLKDFGMPVYSWSNCNVIGNMNNCDLPKYLSKDFNQIINDYINIKQANILWVESPHFNENKGIKLEDQANDLMKLRFYDELLCDSNWEKDGACNYPKTMEIIKWYIRQSAKLIKKSKVVAYDQIVWDAKDPKKIEEECGIWAKSSWKYNILMCGLLWEKENNMQSFMNTLYNELFYYRLFITFYSNNTNTKIKKQQERANTLRQELIRSSNAIDLSLQTLKELYFAYPIHIGFSLYIEDLISLRNQLVKIVTPLSTLYDKLRNVQEKSN